jgi:hypothetical protein
MRQRGRLSDPSWKRGPKEPSPTDSEHAIDPQPSGYDHDGVGKSEAERIDGAALCAVREVYSCSRDGCDISPRKNHVYALTDVSDRVIQAASHAIEYADDPGTDAVIEYLAMHATIVDYDMGPILGFEFGDAELGYVSPSVTVEEGFDGPCYGHAEPDPEPMWRDI